MTSDVEDALQLGEADAAFLARIRRTYDSYPARPAPPVHATLVRDPPRRRWTVPAAVAAALVLATAGGYLGSRDPSPLDRTVARDPASSPDSREPGPDALAAPDRRLVSDLARGWAHRTISDCAVYRPAESPEVVYVYRLTSECPRNWRFGAPSVVFSSLEAGPVGGVGWEAASEAWTTIDGVPVLRKARGEEFSISSTYLQGLWTEEPREYAVYLGSDETAARALDALTSERDGR